MYFRGSATIRSPRPTRDSPSCTDDLSRRGLLDETLVIFMGELGWPPKINRNAGREGR
jgi:hypothetical protein